MHSISFNMETTLHNVNGDIDLMISIAEIVMEDLPELVRRLRVAGDQSDWLNVQQGSTNSADGRKFGCSTADQFGKSLGMFG